MKAMTGVVLAMLLVASPAAAQVKVDGVQVRRLEDAPVNVRLTFYLIQADGFQNEDPEIKPIVTELRKIFRYRGYRLDSKSVIVAAPPPNEGQTVVRQSVSDPDGGLYQIECFVSAKANSGTAFLAVRLYGMVDATTRGETLIDASVNLRDGKTVVLGSARGGSGRAIILAVTPDIED
jgi:hypothetical protein